MNLVVDGCYVLHRSLHVNSSAPVETFLDAVRDWVLKFNPTNIFVAWDDDKNWRHDVMPTYKEHRKDATRVVHPDTFAAYRQRLAAYITCLGFSSIREVGLEGDDIIASLAYRLAGQTVVVSEDRDMFQVVNHRVLLFRPRCRKLFGPDEVKDSCGVSPSNYTLYLALKGDKGDDIPGIEGIGEKRAANLINELRPSNIDDFIDKCKAMYFHNQYAKKVVDSEELFRQCHIVATAAHPQYTRPFEITHGRDPRLDHMRELLEVCGDSPRIRGMIDTWSLPFMNILNKMEQAYGL